MRTSVYPRYSSQHYCGCWIHVQWFCCWTHPFSYFAGTLFMSQRYISYSTFRHSTVDIPIIIWWLDLHGDQLLSCFWARRLNFILWFGIKCQSFQCEGLAIKNLRPFNQALLRKWLWRFGTKREALCRRVIKTKCGSMQGAWCTNVVKGPYSVSLWKSIRPDWENFSHFISFEVGDGTKVNFWSDRWCSDLHLKEGLQELFHLTRNRDALVANHLQLRNNKVRWKSTCCTPYFHFF